MINKDVMVSERQLIDERDENDFMGIDENESFLASTSGRDGKMDFPSTRFTDRKDS